jgi:hypothetical protein
MTETKRSRWATTFCGSYGHHYYANEQAERARTLWIVKLADFETNVIKLRFKLDNVKNPKELSFRSIIAVWMFDLGRSTPYQANARQTW